MSTPIEKRQAEPESGQADQLARRLIEAVGGERPPAEIHRVVAAAYEAVLKGATCAELSVKPDSLIKGYPALFGETENLGDQRPHLPLAVAPGGKGSLVYLRAMDDAEARVAWHISQINVERPEPWPWDPALPQLTVLQLDPEKMPAIEKLHRRRLVIATGGPGTGKTHLIKGLLTCALANGKLKGPEIRLAAPTNRAADRMRRSIAKTTGLEVIPAAQTVHGLLGDRDALAAAQLVIVDEVSMADLALIERLLRCMDPGASLVLAGDPNQLPSVEVGSVLLDLIRPGKFADACVVRLENNHRFAAGSFIAKLAEAVRDRDLETLGKPEMTLEYEAAKLWNYLEEGEAPGAFTRIKLLAETRGADGDVVESKLSEALTLLETQRVLCSHRVGPMGSQQLSRWILEKLEMESDQSDGAIVMVLRNDHRLGVYNGDIGIVSDGNVYFATGSGLVRVGLSSLPEHELAFASTIHKAQGSEYDRVAIVLGESQQESFMSRELLYTAITRAKRDVRIFQAPGALAKCLGNDIQRVSGLSERLERMAAGKPSPDR